MECFLHVRCIPHQEFDKIFLSKCACVFVCAFRSCDGEGRKDKGGGEKVRDVKTVVWIKLSIRMYVCRYLCISCVHAFFHRT